jgi:hypothetical protein
MEIVFQNIQLEKKLFNLESEGVRMGRADITFTVALNSQPSADQPYIYGADLPKGHGIKGGTGGRGREVTPLSIVPSKGS